MEIETYRITIAIDPRRIQIESKVITFKKNEYKYLKLKSKYPNGYLKRKKSYIQK